MFRSKKRGVIKLSVAGLGLVALVLTGVELFISVSKPPAATSFNKSLVVTQTSDPAYYQVPPTSSTLSTIEVTTKPSATLKAPPWGEPLPTLQDMQLAGLPVAVYLPLENMSTPTASDRPAVQVLFVLHGMFMNGGAFAKNLLGFARQNHMLLIAPTFHYESNFKDPQIITSEDTTLTAKLNQIAAQIETQTGIPLKLHFLFYGFSRGAQLAHHYAMLFPEKTLGVVAMSGGAYTLPYREYPSDRKSGQSLPFPFGVVGLSHYDGHSFDQTTFDRIHFLIEVGANDTNPNDVSRAWDPYIGNNRLIRAQHFYQALKQLGVNAQLTVFPGTFHQVTPAMTKAALSFFSKLTS